MPGVSALLTKEYPNLSHALLPNGLKLFVYESHRSPIVISSLWVRCGSNYESDEVLGWSHGIEHMLFQGTKKRKAGEAAREVKRAGGELNASTSYDMTNYYIMVPRDMLSLALDIQSDYVTAPLFETGALDIERQVIIEETKMYEDQPFGFGRSWDELLKLAFKKSPYRRRIIGPKKSIRHASLRDILRYKERFYVPNNMALVVAGDVQPRAVLPLAKKYFGALKKKKFALPKIAAEPRQKSFRAGVIHGDITQAYVKVGYHMPAVSSPDYHAILVLLYVMTEGRSSRLYTGLKEKMGLVHDVESFHEIGRDHGIAGIEVVCDPGKVRRAGRQLLHEFSRLRKEPVDRAELETALTQMEKKYLFNQETVEGMAGYLGRHWIWGDFRAAFEYLDHIRAVTVQDLQRVAARYFYSEGASVLAYLPHGVRLEAKKLATGVMPRATVPARAPGREEQPVRSGKKEKIKRAFLRDGVPLIYLVDRELPVATVGCLFRGGNYFENAASNGISRFTLNAMLKGTASRTAEALARDLEILGSTITPLGTSDFVSFFITTLKRNLPDSIRLLCEIIREPSFPVDNVERERQSILSSINQVEDDSFQFAFLEFKKRLFNGHPYGMPVIGTRRSIRKIRRRDLAAWHRAHCGTRNLGITLVGDFDPEEIHGLLETEIASFRRAAAPRPSGTDGFRIPAGRRFTVQKDLQQAVIIIGMPAPKMSSRDYFAVKVLEESLSGMAGRLFVELRDRQGLCYYTSGIYYPFKESGMLGAFIATAPDKVETAEKGLMVELEKIEQKGITARELALARNSLIGSFTIENQSTTARAILNGRNEILELGYNAAEKYVREISRVSRADVHRVARKYIRPDKAVTLVLTP